jgi:hypothetical protein
MADDINSYALNLAFQLQAAPAISSLGDILSSITNIQNGLQKVSAILSAPVTKSLTYIQDQVSKISTSSTDISKTATQLETDLTAIQQHYEEIDRLNTNTAKTGLKSFLDLDKIRKWIPQLLKEQKSISDEGKVQAQYQEEIVDAVKANQAAGDQSLKQGKAQVDIGNQVAAAWHGGSGAVAQFAHQGRDCAESSNLVAAAWHGVSKGVKDTVLGFAEMLIGIQAIRSALSLFVEEENKFNTANYRLYGLQKEIIGQVNKLTVQYGLMRRPAMEAMTILGASIRTTDEELGKLVNTNVQFSKILGVAQKDLADWQRAMRSLGIRDAEAILLRYATAMRRLGMSAEQLNRILNQQAKSAATMKSMFGSEGTTELNGYNVSLTAFANKMGMSTEQVAQLSDGLGKLWADPDALARIKGMGHAIEEAYDTMAPAEQAKADLRAYVKVSAETFSAIQDHTMRQIAIRQRAAALGMDEQALMAMISLQTFEDSAGKTVDLLRKSSKEMSDFIAAESAYARDKAFAEALKAGEGQEFLYREATQSISDSFTKMWGKIESAWSNLAIAVAPAIIWLMDNVLSPLIDALSWVFNLLSGSLTPAVDQATAAVGKMSEKVEPAVGFFDRMWQVLKGLGGGILVLAGGVIALGVAFIGLRIGIALWRAFMEATSAPKLLALAIAAVAVGAGFLMIAAAFVRMAQLGWSIIGPLVAVVVVIGALTAALMALGTFGWLGVAASIALAAAFLGLGFSALMVSWAFENVVSSISKLADIGALSLLGIGLALIAFGAELTLAAVTIGIGATAMTLAVIPLIAAMTGLSMAMFLLSDSAVEKMVRLSDGTMQRFGTALGSLGPGIITFIASMGYGIKFAAGMRGLSSGINKIDPTQTMLVGNSLIAFGRALEAVSRFEVGNLSGISSSVLTFADSLVIIFDELKAAVDRAVLSMTIGLFGIAFVMWQLRENMTNAFIDLLFVIPVITDVTDRIAAAIESGQHKIESQIETLRASFIALESISSKLGVPTSVEEEDKKKVMAETISTIQVKTETTGAVVSRWKQEEMQQKQVELMNTIAEAVDKISGGANLEDVGAIKLLLQTYLPKMGESPSKLSTRLNNWS